jgi:post-segregation antitoxin (ccd killing protein)
VAGRGWAGPGLAWNTFKRGLKMASIKINVSIPEELHRELQEYKGNINVSGICQSALRGKIANIKKYEWCREKAMNVLKSLS